jgi:cytochrome b
MKKIRVWDLPVRLFHWTLAVLVVASLVTQKIGGNAMQWHFLSGYAILALLLFRIVWGLVGSRYARFADFLHGPGVVMSYLRNAKNGIEEKYQGHNPLGSLSVFALLGVLLAQVGTGLFSNDDIANDGPLVRFTSKELSDRITWLHKDVTGNLIYALVALHVAAILYYYFRKRQNLVKPMITGDKEIDVDAPSANDGWGMRLFAAVVLSACAAAVYWLVHLKA